MTAVLGLHKDNWHDTGAALVYRNETGQRAIAHVSQERLDRNKGSRAFPLEAAEACLEMGGLSSYGGADLVVLDHTVDSNDWRADYLRNPCRTDVFLADVEAAKLRIVRHHLCHAAASFFTSPFNEAAILIVDGRGSSTLGAGRAFETQTLWFASGNRIELVEESSCIGIGLIYEAITQYLGFGFLEAGKTMGLAPFGGPELLGIIRGRFAGLGTHYEDYCDYDSTLLRPLPPVHDDAAKAALARAMQQECERAMLSLVRYSRGKVASKNLCLGGGVALNCVANARIRSSKLFDAMHVNPACSDSGIPLGASLWGYHCELDNIYVPADVSPYTGPRYSRDRAEQAIRQHQATATGNSALAQAAEMLRDGKTVALFQGRSEMGPRALGNRSILMAPFSAERRDHLNNVVKRREPFRPFAPVVPEADAARYFECGDPSPFMLFTTHVKEQYRQLLRAVTHIDGTARLQTVSSEQNARLHRLLLEFGQLSGTPVLLNTSFNIAGEPLVETPEDAVRCFERNGIDALLLEETLLVKQGGL